MKACYKLTGRLGITHVFGQIAFVALFVFICCASKPVDKKVEGNSAMSNNFESLFSAAVTGDAETYRAARERLAVEAHKPELQKIATASADWRAKLIATIAIGWIEHDSVYEEVARYVRGDWPFVEDRIPASGVHNSNARETKIVALGEIVVPRLIEMFWRSEEYADAIELETIAGALREFYNLFPPDPLFDIIADAVRKPELRVHAVALLDKLPDQRVPGVLRKGAMDTTWTAEMRGYACNFLGEMHDSASQELLAGLAGAKNLDRTIQIGAILGLQYMGTLRARQLVEQLALSESDNDMLESFIETLGEIGDKVTLGILARLAQMHSENKELVGYIHRASFDIKTRLENESAPSPDGGTE